MIDRYRRSRVPVRLWLIVAMVAHPMKPELNGKPLNDFEDAKGKKLYVAIVDVVKADGAGFVDYMWDREGDGNAVPKLSYVAGFQPWGWVVGTGIYIDDVDAAVRAETITVAWQTALNLLVICVLAFIVSRSISRPVADVSAQMLRLASGAVVEDGAAATGLVETRDALEDLSAYLRDAAGVAESIADGDLTVDVRPRSEQDALGGALQRMAGQLGTLVGNVSETAGRLTTASREMAATSDEAGRAVGEIASAVSDVAHRAERQVRMVETSRAAVQEAARAATASLGSAPETAAAADEGVATVARTRDAFQQIATAVEGMRTRVGDIATSVAQISDEAQRAAHDITEVAAVAEEPSASAEQVSASTQETSASTQEIAASAQELARTAEELDELVRRFKIAA